MRYRAAISFALFIVVLVLIKISITIIDIEKFAITEHTLSFNKGKFKCIAMTNGIGVGGGYGLGTFCGVKKPKPVPKVVRQEEALKRCLLMST